MARSNVVKLRSKDPRGEAAPGLAGLSVGRIEGKAARGVLRVRLLDGTLLDARPADGVDPGFLDDCHRERRTVLLAPAPEGAVVLGALQIGRAIAPEKGSVRVSGEHIDLCAEKGVTISAGKASLRLDERGTIHLAGQKATVSMARLVRVLAALVELP